MYKRVSGTYVRLDYHQSTVHRSCQSGSVALAGIGIQMWFQPFYTSRVFCMTAVAVLVMCVVWALLACPRSLASHTHASVPSRFIRRLLQNVHHTVRVGARLTNKCGNTLRVPGCCGGGTTDTVGNNSRHANIRRLNTDKTVRQLKKNGAVDNSIIRCI